MDEATYSRADLELFAGLYAAARDVGIEPCLIGAGAIQLGPALNWGVRLGRRTRDWDFAVRTASWEEFDTLGARLTARGAGFERALEPHRFRHRSGGTLDVVPYGPLEDPPGRIQWPEGISMETVGFEVLDDHRCLLDLGEVQVRTASLPALVGLKVLAYGSRRPGVTHDIGDVHSILRQVDATGPSCSIDAHIHELLDNESVRFTELGSYQLGRNVAGVFALTPLDAMIAVLSGEVVPGQALAQDVRRSGSESGWTDEEILTRLSAFHLGLVDA